MEVVTALYLLILTIGTIYLYSKTLASKDKEYRDENTIYNLTVELSDCNDRNRVLSKKRVSISPLPCRDALTNNLIDIIHKVDDTDIDVCGMRVEYRVREKCFYIEELRLSLHGYIAKTEYHPRQQTLPGITGSKIEMIYGRAFCEHVTEIILIRLGG